MANLQAKISELMTQKKVSAIDIERVTGLNRNTVYSIIAGNSKNPSAHNLQLIAKALGVSLGSILINEEEVKPEVLNPVEMKVFSEAINATINIIIQKNLSLSIDKVVSIAKEAYKYSIKTEPHIVDERFIHWIIDKDNS